jgi:2-polyprenyl-6-methoxyphenol hydroxylase-like FAD-dependent oxidoreductase
MGVDVDYRPRAAHYATPAVRELEKAGILDDVIAEGFKPHGVCWRRPNGELLAILDHVDTLDDRYALVCLPLGQLGALMVRHTKQYPNITVRWDHEVIAISQDEKVAKVVANTKDGQKEFEGDYVVGCDGANSKVRRELFGEWNYPGKTWDEYVVATNVPLSSSYLITGLLSFRKIWLYRFQFHHSS